MRESWLIRHYIFIQSLPHQIHLHIILNESQQLCYLIDERLKVGMVERYFRAVRAVRVCHERLILVGLHYDIRCGAEHQQDHVDVHLLLLGRLLHLNLLLEIVSRVPIDKMLVHILTTLSHF